MAKKIVFETEVNAGGVDAGLKMVEAKAAAANGRMNRTVYEAQKNAGQLNKAQIQARAEFQAKEEHRAKRKAEVDAARSRPVQGPDLHGVQRAKAAADEVAKYQERLVRQSPGSFINPRGTMAADQSAWASRLNAAKAQVAAQRNLEASFSPRQPFTTGSGSHQFTQADKMGKGRGFGVASSMFVSVARDSAASLASGAPALQVMAQQAPQVLQAVTMIGGGIMKWGLGIAATAGALVGFHYLTKKIGDEWSGIADQMREIERLDKRSAALKKVRAEQVADFAAADAREKAAGEEAALIREASVAIGNARSSEREARELDPKKRQDMIIDRLAGAQMRAAFESQRSAQSEFSGIPGARLKARQDELKTAEADAALAEAIQARKNMDSGMVTPRAARAGGLSGGDSLVRVGNFLGSARGKIESLAQKQVEILTRIEINTRPKSGNTATYSP